MKKTKKILIMVFILICISTLVLAIDNPNFYEPGDLDQADENKVGIITGNVLSYIKVVGICISVIMLTIIGLKYMLSSIEEKANYKENMIPYVAGCFLLACATVIPSIVYELVNK